ncbi:hypothetical protein BP5796_02996 [Coleophoma crateriformis]|uniref:Uncharacterized protein n=1 Tax=Coleophoma crateriformis TaxID=565419 RepID=A0A3D8SM05_9HELO|nr:hypothetical protein BP5796_02996 [Coleophoma crateriformis]
MGLSARLLDAGQTWGVFCNPEINTAGIAWVQPGVVEAVRAEDQFNCHPPPLDKSDAAIQDMRCSGSTSHPSMQASRDLLERFFAVAKAPVWRLLSPQDHGGPVSPIDVAHIQVQAVGGRNR